MMRLHKEVGESKIKEVLNEFQGKIYQRPPLRASVKRRLRTRTIYNLDFLELAGKNVLFEVGCEGGTYIRKLCYDVGEAIGCGAHMQELRRTRAGVFTEDNGLVTLYDILYYASKCREIGDEEPLREIIVPSEKALELLPRIYIRDSAVAAVCHGASVTAPGVLSLDNGIEEKNIVAVLTQKGEAVAFARALASSEQILNASHGFVARTDRVLMDRDTYPKLWSRNRNS